MSLSASFDRVLSMGLCVSCVCVWVRSVDVSQGSVLRGGGVVKVCGRFGMHVQHAAVAVQASASLRKVASCRGVCACVL